jgi:ABC-type polysaccharide/polyol phosphate export permease
MNAGYRPDKVVTYEPDNSLKSGYLAMFGEIFQEILENRWLIYQLFKRDFVAAYKQSLIGIFWAVILPIISIGTFLILNRSGVVAVGQINVPYPIYATLGMAFWQVFSAGLVATSNSLVNAGALYYCFCTESGLILSLSSLLCLLFRFGCSLSDSG